ncbi:MAG: PepSY domain-containing protein, partial [Gammaproteobacteria bacterium]|jgi:uncharacterized membrane protein YkoI
MIKKLILFVALAVTSVIGGYALGDDDHQESRRMMQQGEILPLQQILDNIAAERKGRVLEVELKRKKQRVIYEIELLGEHGRVWEFKVDAASGEILKREQEE